MTFKALLLECRFEDVANSIRALYGDQVQMLPHYKEVFDQLCHTSAVPSEGYIEVRMESSEYAGSYVRIDGLHDVSIEEALGRALQIEGEMPLEEIAARCLWEYTFYGFSEEDTTEMFAEWEGRGFSHYGERACLLQRKFYRGLIYKDKEEKKRLLKPSGAFCMAFTLENWKEIHLHKRRCNRSRRRRNCRLDNRIKALQRKDKVQWLIQRLTANPSPRAFKPGDLDFLFSTTLIYEMKFHSYAYDVHRRVAYLHELIEKYSSYNFQGYTQYLVHITTSSEHPVAPEESLDFIKAQFPEHAKVMWGFSYDDSLEQEIGVLIVACK